jgi:hypothetical protein
MKFNPKSKEEAMSAGLLPKGNYPFVVKNATEEVSKSGNSMVKLILCVWDENGREHTLFDYLMESIEYKLHHFCYAIGLEDISLTGEFDCHRVIGTQGVCKIYIKEDKTGEYPPKNAIADYVLKEKNKNEKEIKGSKESKEEFIDSEIPF